MRIETLAAHAGLANDTATGAVVPPIHLSTTFERSADGSFPHGYSYTRSDNPNRAALEQCLCELEAGASWREAGLSAVTFASGMAAIMSVFQALNPGDHVVAPTDAYYGTSVLLRDTFTRWGLQVSFVDMADLTCVRAALLPNTRLVWVETPSNPLLKITDIAGVSRIAHEVGALCVCDNTWATPVLQRPIALGADMVMHSTTKYLNGHGDVLGGAIIGPTQLPIIERVRQLQRTGGAVPSPFDCWLVLRGLRTLPYRMRAHSDSAFAIARFLAGHPSVRATHYPGLESHPGHAIAARQMALFGGMLSFQVGGGAQQALGVAARLRVVTRATSLGSPESLIEHRASVEGPTTTTPQDLLRLSVGLEHVDDLLEDLDQALA